MLGDKIHLRVANRNKECERVMVHQDLIFSFNHPRPGRVSEVACVLSTLQALLLSLRIEVSEDAGIKDLFRVECFALQHAWPIQLRGFPMASRTNDALQCFAHDQQFFSWTPGSGPQTECRRCRLKSKCPVGLRLTVAAIAVAKLGGHHSYCSYLLESP